MPLSHFIPRRLNTKFCLYPLLFFFNENFLGYREPEGIAVFSSSLSIMLHLLGLWCRITWLFCCHLWVPFCVDVFLQQEPKSPPMSPICSPPASPSTYQRIPVTYGYSKSRSGLEQQHGGREKVGMCTLYSIIILFFFFIEASKFQMKIAISLVFLKFNYIRVLENDPIMSFYFA